MTAEKQKKLDYHADLPGYGMGNNVVLRQAKRSYLEPFLGKIYTKHLNAENNEKAYALMEQGRTPDTVIVEQYKPGPEAKEQQPFRKISDRADLKYSSFNRLIFEAHASHPGFFGLAYPYTGHWQAFANGQKTPVYRANGASHAVRIPAGVSKVEFRYQSPASFWGMMLSCLTLGIIGLVAGLHTRKKSAAALIIAMSLTLSTCGFMLWYQSLYTGDNIGTAYRWTPEVSEHSSNLAYGKRTDMSSNYYGSAYPYIFASGRAIDGDRTPESGFMTRLQKNPWWILDLHRPEMIGSVIIYESLRGPKYNTRPLKVAVSDDQKEWHTTPVSNYGYPLKVIFEKPVKARYVLIGASGYCRLAFDEVEAFLIED